MENIFAGAPTCGSRAAEIDLEARFRRLEERMDSFEQRATGPEPEPDPEPELKKKAGGWKKFWKKAKSVVKTVAKTVVLVLKSISGFLNAVARFKEAFA